MSWDRRFYRRDGTPYPPGSGGFREWVKDFENPDLRTVTHDILPNGYAVSTIWLGINWGDGPPLIFETMVFHQTGEATDYQKRYATENDAIIGHIQAVDQFSKITSKGVTW